MGANIGIDTTTCDSEDLDAAARWFAAGGIVAYPTDTFYGLAVDPRSATAVQALFDLKGRDARVAMPLLAASFDQVESAFGAIDDASRRLAQTFWPGPLSLILNAPVLIVAGVHGGLGTVAVRVPAHPVARALAAELAFPVTATSANRSGEPPASAAGDLGIVGTDPRVMVIDSGDTPGGRPSTIVDARSTPPTLVRDGAIAWTRVLESLHG